MGNDSLVSGFAFLLDIDPQFSAFSHQSHRFSRRQVSRFVMLHCFLGSTRPSILFEHDVLGSERLWGRRRPQDLRRARSRWCCLEV